MQQIGAFEAKNTLGSLLDRVEHGEEILITRHGKPVAKLVAASEQTNRAAVDAAMQRMRNRARKLQLGAFDWDEFKADRDAGRR
jgi:prevent-host-death family protein